MSATILLGGQVDKLPGGHDDGSDDGVLHAKLLGQGLVKVPIISGQIVTGTAGTATVTTASTLINTDGTQVSYLFTVPAVTAGAQSMGWMETTLYGRRVGVRFRRNNSATLPPFTVWVDGVPYAVRQVANRRHASAVVSSTDYEGLFMVADDLGPGPHTVRVSVAGDIIGGASRSLVFFGFIADKAAGYEYKQRPGTLNPTTTVLTTTAATVPSSYSGIIRKLYFHNTDATARIVTVTVGGSVFKVLSLAAGTSGEIDLGPGVQTSQATMTWKADAAAVVNAWAQEVQ